MSNDKEDIGVDVLSDDSGEVYIPEAEERNLEVDESAYTLLEHISLEWPSQSVAASDNFVFFGNCPNMKHKASREALKIGSLNLRKLSSLVHKEAHIDYIPNRIRVNEQHVYVLSEASLTSFTEESLEKRCKLELNGGYGLYVTKDRVFAGTADGKLIICDKDLNVISEHRHHTSSIESIAVSNGIILTGSSDCTLVCIDATGRVLKRIQNTSDVNAVDIKGKQIVFGDDEGRIHLYDLEKETEEVIEWHKSPISYCMWMDDDVFLSCSDEQVCIWDTSLCDDNSPYHKYLLFVHQGERFYKECCLVDNMVITTSQDGLCIFTPISFKTE